MSGEEHKKKTIGIKHKVREEREKEKRLSVAITVAVLIAIITILAFTVHFALNPSQTTITGEPKAAIVDQGSQSLTGGSNPDFIENVTDILEQAGYEVDYYPGEDVTVDFYRNLPTHGYILIVLRTHSAPLVVDGIEKEMVNLFTCEVYSTSSHVSEQLNDEVVIATYYEGSPQYFGITPSFIKNRMKGNFNNATIIMMGCDGLKYTSTAEAFIEKGAKVYISWNGPVSSGHTDAATTNLLRHLLTEKQTIKDSLSQTFREVGFDPNFFSQLAYYPLSVGEQTIGDTKRQH